MAVSHGKQFETKFKEDWLRSFPNSVLIRLPDQMNGYKATSANVCDFLAFNNHTFYLLECKSHKGNTLPFTAIPQYERMLPYVGLEGVRAGLVVWFEDHPNAIAYVPIATMKQMVEEGKKSIHINDFDDMLYKIILIPSIKKRTFYDSDYKILLTALDEGD